MNEQYYKVSIIMGIYNCGKTLQDALDSLYCQTFQDFEIIMCDDGSSDDTYEIASRNRQEHANIVLLKNSSNIGLNQTLNNCLAVAKGKYIARMDGDDISKPDRLEKEVTFLDNNHEYAIVSTPMEYFDENGVFGVGKAVGEPQKLDFIKGTPFCHAPCMVRREAYEAVNGYSVSKRLIRLEDYHLWLKMYCKGYRGFRLNEPLYMMRDDRNAIHRRTYRSRMNESYVKYMVYKELKLPFYSIVYCLRPLIVGLLPTFLYKKLHKSFRG